MDLDERQTARAVTRRVVGGCVLATTLSVAVPAAAMPTFARKYETSCATCHQAFPRLNAVGESFRLNGFRFVDDESYRKQHPVEIGDEAYKKLWPRALWPTDIPRNSPLSFIARMMAEGDLDNTRPKAVTYLLPEEIELVFAGTLGDDISLYGDAIFLQKDFGGAKPESWATLKAWIQFQGLVGEHALNLRVGTVGTQSIGLFTARDANFYGTHYYLYTSWLVPAVDTAAAGLSAFTGNPFTLGPQAGLEANGFGERWSYAVGIANGGLTAPASGPPDGDIVLVGMGGGGGSDSYLQLAYKLGGIPFDRSRERPEQTLAPAAEFWRDDSATFSLFAYRGKATIRTVAVDGTTTDVDDSFWRAGVGVQTQYRDLSVSAAWVEGRNDRPYGALSPGALDSHAWHVETIWFAYPWLLPYARYEALRLDMPEGVPGVDPRQDIARLMIGAKAMVRPNLGLVVETAIYNEGAALEEGFDRTLFALLSVSF